MSTSRRNFLIVNLGLIVLIGAMIWFLSTRGQDQFVSLPEPETKPATPVTAKPAEPAISTEGLSSADREAIEALQAQLAAEKAKAEQSRAQIEARQAEKATRTGQAQPGNGDSTPYNDLEVEDQKKRIARMIEAQLKGVAEENQRLAEELARKNREIEVVRQQNTTLTRRLSTLDNSAQNLLANLMEGDNISRSDLDYIGAMQDLAKDTGQTPANTDVDLINRVEVADSGDTGSASAQLRNLVNQLMEEPAEPVSSSSVNNQLNTVAAGRSGDIQNSVNALMVRNEQREADQQLQADEAYLESLTEVEEERQNETRWVTVRQGDTLYDIAARVYEDGWLYPKIFEANPQVLSNPDRIKPGQRLRVPL